MRFKRPSNMSIQAYLNEFDKRLYKKKSYDTVMSDDFSVYITKISQFIQLSYRISKNNYIVSASNYCTFFKKHCSICFSSLQCCVEPCNLCQVKKEIPITLGNLFVSSVLIRN